MNARGEGKFARSISFSEDIAFRGARIARFKHGGPSTASINYSYDDRQEIGSYRGEIPLERLEHAHRVLVASDYRQLPRRRVLPPETPCVAISEDDATQFATFPSAEVPPQLEAALSELRGLIDWLRQFPLAALRVQAEWRENPIRVGDPLELAIRFASIGSEPITIGNPLRLGSPKAVLKLAISADGKAWEYADLTESDRVATGAAPEGDDISLASKRSWELMLTKQLPLARGRHEVQLKYDSNLTRSTGSTNLPGQVPIKLPALVVQ